MFGLNGIRNQLEHLDRYKARQFEVDSLVIAYGNLRAEFDALVKSLGVKIEQVPQHYEVKPE